MTSPVLASGIEPGLLGGALSTELKDILRFLRLEQVPRFMRRALGLPSSWPSDFRSPVPEEEAARLRAIADRIRGPDAPPAIFVHGVLPRSGTNFLTDALALHPEVCAHPGRLWEFPLLYVAPGAEALQQEFLFMFGRNREVMGRYDLLAHLASGWLRALQSEAGDRRVLLKSPHVQNLGLLPHLFPHDIAFLCLRDGRDVIQSSVSTFQRRRLRSKGFAALAREWSHAAEAMLAAESERSQTPGLRMVRYEALVRDPEAEMRSLLAHASLDAEQYDFEALRQLPVRGSSAVASADVSRWDAHDKPTDFRPVGRWQSTWTERQKNRFKAIAGETLIRTGYAPDHRW